MHSHTTSKMSSKSEAFPGSSATDRNRKKDLRTEVFFRVMKSISPFHVNRLCNNVIRLQGKL